MTTVEVKQKDRRPVEEMNDKRQCDHERIYQNRDGMWCCADCPAFAWNKKWFYAGVAVPKGKPPVVSP